LDADPGVVSYGDFRGDGELVPLARIWMLAIAGAVIAVVSGRSGMGA
jgi:hypothetical protein